MHTIKDRLGNITDNVSRAVIWTALWNLTRDAELPAQDYIDIVMLHGANEPNPSIIEQVFANAYMAATKFTTDPTVIADLVYSLWDLMYQAKPGSDTQLVLVRAAITALAADRKPGSARKLRELLGGHLAGLVLSPDIRWRIIAALASHDDVTAQELLAEREADNTLDGQAAYLQAMYSYPHAKQQAFDDLLHAMDYSNEEVNALIAGFRAPTDPHQGSHHNTHPATPDFAAEFFANLNHIWTEYPIEIANRIVRGLYPETAAAVAKTEEILETELPGAPPAYSLASRGPPAPWGMCTISSLPPSVRARGAASSPNSATSCSPHPKSPATAARTTKPSAEPSPAITVRRPPGCRQA